MREQYYIMRILSLLSLFLALIFILPQNIYANEDKEEKLKVDAGYGHVVMPELFSNSVLIDDDEEPPVEPNIIKVKFLKLPEISGIKERVDRLVQGIDIDLPPEYDHYGYEIRRYMASVGNLKIFEDDDFLIEQIKNTRKAKVIAEYWKKHINEEIKELDKIVLEDDNISFSVRTAFKQNKVTTRAFLISLEAWIEKNEDFLMVILENPSSMYEVLYPEIIIKDDKLRNDFFNKLNVKQVKLKEIREYQPFAMMVY